MSLVLVAALLAAGPSNAKWVEVPPQDSVPGFRVRLSSLGGTRVRVEFDGAAGVDRRAVGLHLWLADAELVARRVADLRTAQAALANAKALILDQNYAEPDCHARLERFVTTGAHQLAVLRDEDPFTQIFVRFAEASAAAPAGVLAAQFNAGLVAEFDVGGVFEAAHGEIAAVSVGARLQPIAGAVGGPISKVVQVGAALRLTLSPEVALEVLALGSQPYVLRPKAGVYQVYRRGDLAEVGCFGVDGNFTVPGAWYEPKFFSHDEGGVSLRGSGSRVAFGQGARTAVATFSLGAPTADEVKLVDFRVVKEGVVLVATFSGPSRPGNAMGQCGAGTETDLVWVWLSPELAVKKQQVVPLESCFQSVEFEAADGGWSVRDFSHERSSTVRYDSTHPVAGVRVQSGPLK